LVTYEVGIDSVLVIVPGARRMDEGKPAAARLSVIAIGAPFAGADPVRLTLALVVPQPPITVVEDSEKVVRTGGRTVSVAVFVTSPYVAETLTAVGVLTTFGKMFNSRDRFVTTKLGGSGNTAGLLLTRVTGAPLGCGSVRVMRALDTFPPASVDGVSVSDERLIAVFCSVITLFSGFGSSDGAWTRAVCENVPPAVVRTTMSTPPVLPKPTFGTLHVAVRPLTVHGAKLSVTLADTISTGPLTVSVIVTVWFGLGLMNPSSLTQTAMWYWTFRPA
jgi:hypothetical protein